MGFEPTKRLTVYTLSRDGMSTDHKIEKSLLSHSKITPWLHDDIVRPENGQKACFSVFTIIAKERVKMR